LITASDKTVASGLKYIRNEDAHVIEVIVEGKITAADIEHVVEEIEVDLTKHEKLRILEDIREFKGIDPMALWLDLKQINKLSRISHVAIVADLKWVRTLAEAMSGLYPFEVKVYERAEIAAARVWLNS
ncbi:MAG: STAS/SEC14 domain-containing protein, partial [Cyanobacteria bacterium J06576_12]